MTMHLERGLTTLYTKKRKERVTKAKHEQLERDWRDRNLRLKQMGLPKESFEQFLEFVYGRKQAVNTTPETNNRSDSYNHKKVDTNPVKPQSLGRWITGPVSSKPSPIYTGTKVKGIGTMHKSNAVPIFSDDEAIDISRMRR